jgi:hypothetical protein
MLAADINPDLVILAVFGVICALYFIAVIFERFLPGDDLTEYYKAERGARQSQSMTMSETSAL